MTCWRAPARCRSRRVRGRGTTSTSTPSSRATGTVETVAQLRRDPSPSAASGLDADPEQQGTADHDLFHVHQHGVVPLQVGEQGGGDARMIRAADGQEQAGHGDHGMRAAACADRAQLSCSVSTIDDLGVGDVPLDALRNRPGDPAGEPAPSDVADHDDVGLALLGDPAEDLERLALAGLGLDLDLRDGLRPCRSASLTAASAGFEPRIW